MPLNENLSLDSLPEWARESVERGMRGPRAVTLAPGQVLFRFASSDAPPALWAAGPWWLYEHDYRKIVEQERLSRAQHGPEGLTLGWLGRSAAAVQQSWSRMDVVVKAVVLQEVMAFAGRGRTQYKERGPNGFLYTISGWPNVEQLYIPNIGDRQGRTLLGYQALHVLRQKRVESQQMYDRG